jgi:hypothetical protein
MKKRKLIELSLALAVCGLGVVSLNAQELFSAVVATTKVTTNGSGGLSYSHYGNKQIIEEAAESAGLTNSHGLRVVYNRTADDLEVVAGTNNTVITTPLTFADSLSLARTNQTLLERLAWVFVGTGTNAAGTLRDTERAHFGPTNQLTHFSLIGRLQYAAPASGTNEGALYSGVLTAGPAFGPDNDRDHDD